MNAAIRLNVRLLVATGVTPLTLATIGDVRAESVATNEAKVLPPAVGAAQRESDITKAPHALTAPAALKQESRTYWSLFKICVDTSGAITNVSVLKSAGEVGPGATKNTARPLPPEAKELDAIWTTAVKTWRYRPYLVNGSAVPFCYPQRLQFAVEPNAVMLAPDVGTSLRITDATKPPHAIRLPPELNKPGMVVWGLYKICVNTQGEVDWVNVLKSAHDEATDRSWSDTVKTWKYRPYAVNGKPVPFCHPIRLQVSVR